MRSQIVLALLAALLLVAAVQAKEPKRYQSGQLLQMDSVQCGIDEKDGKTITGEMLGTDSGRCRAQRGHSRIRGSYGIAYAVDQC